MIFLLFAGVVSGSIGLAMFYVLERSSDTASILRFYGAITLLLFVISGCLMAGFSLVAVLDFLEVLESWAR